MRKLRIPICFLIVYIIGFLYYAIFDENAAIIHIIIFPLTAIPTCIFIQKKKIALSIFLFLFFISMGINSPIFFMTRDRYPQWGAMNAVGDFDFSIISYLKYFFPLYIFVIVTIIVYSLLVSFCKLSCNRNTNSSLVQNAHSKYIVKTNIVFDFLCIIVCCLAGILSIWMFQNKIAVSGITPIRLPFHLSGILLYFRNYILPLVIFFLYVKSKKKIYTILAVWLGALVLGTTSTSKGVMTMVLVPLIFEAFYFSRYVNSFISSLLYAYLYYVVPYGREYTYSRIDQKYYFVGIVSYILDRVHELDISIPYVVRFLVDYLSARAYGGGTLVISAQYHGLGIKDILRFYSGTQLSDIINNMALNMFHMVLPDNMSIGVGIGFIGTVVVLSDGSIFCMIVQGILVGCVLSVLEICCWTIISHAKRKETVIVVLIIVLTFIAGFYYQFLPYKIFFALGIFIIIFAYFIKNFRFKR